MSKPLPPRTPHGERKRLADVFRSAAKNVEKHGGFSCLAIRTVVGGDHLFFFEVPEVIAYVRLMSPRTRGDMRAICDALLDAMYAGAKEDPEVVSMRRVLALCFAAAITERP